MYSQKRTLSASVFTFRVSNVSSSVVASAFFKLNSIELNE